MVLFTNLAANSQSNACSRVLISMQALKGGENFVEVHFIEVDVGLREAIFTLLAFRIEVVVRVKSVRFRKIWTPALFWRHIPTGASILF